MSIKILLAGFTPFAGLHVNPSEEIVRRISENTESFPGVLLAAEVLPTEFEAAGTRIRESICRFLPQSVLILGVAPGSGQICLERLAVNIDDSDMPDLTGDTPSGRLIETAGPAAYWVTLPLSHLSKMLESRKIPVRLSNHAGTYVCNHALYAALHVIEERQLNVGCGLAHIPLMSEQTEIADGRLPALPLASMVDAVRACIEVLRDDCLTRQ
jgi:pyroglutamyl-peptidase